MLRILQISITFIFVTICTTTAQTTIQPPMAPRCEGDICYCVEGTHEEFFRGRKYCAPDSTEPCPEYAVRLSAKFCECRKGYHFLNDDRKVCVPDHIEEITTVATTETTTTPKEPTPMAPRCEGDICDCIEGTHEAFFNGRKYCETDSTEPCPEYAIRLSPEVCECKKGYHFLNDERKVCVPEETIDHTGKETPIIPTTTTTTQRPNMRTTTTSTSTQSDRSGESEIPSNTVYIYVGIIVLVITALILIAFLWLHLKR